MSQAAPIAAAGTPLEVEQGLRERCQAAVAAALAAGADQAEAYASQRDSREVALEKGDIQLARTQASFSRCSMQMETAPSPAKSTMLGSTSWIRIRTDT